MDAIGRPSWAAMPAVARGQGVAALITVIRGIRSLAEFCLEEFLLLVEIHKSFWRGIEIHTF